MTTTTFSYTGSYQFYTVPSGVTQISVECWGAQGGGVAGYLGGLGGYIKAVLPVTPGDTYYVYVGQQGYSTGSGAYNGGGQGYNAGDGGGASDIRQNSTALTNRRVVAGGGGGNSQYGTGTPGTGGGNVGGDGTGGTTGYATAPGGTQTGGGNNGYGGGTAGTSGTGGSGYPGSGSSAGGGGGGYYGGSGGNTNGCGGGGSAWMYTASGGSILTNSNGVRSGHGQVVISDDPIVAVVAAPTSYSNSSIPTPPALTAAGSISAPTAFASADTVAPVAGLGVFAVPAFSNSSIVTVPTIVPLVAVTPPPAIASADSVPATMTYSGASPLPGVATATGIPPTTSIVTRVAPTYTDAQYKAKFLDGQVQVTRRVAIFQSDGTTLWSDAGPLSRLISGGVSVDYTRDERRSLDIELANFDKALAHQPSQFWYDKIIACYRGIKFNDGFSDQYYEVPLGQFIMDQLDYDRFPHTVQVTARDFTKKCMLSKLTQAEAYPAATAVEDLVNAMAANSGIFNRTVPVTGKTLGIDAVYEAGTSRWEIMKNAANAAGYELFFNAQAYLEMRAYLDPTTSPVNYKFAIGPGVGNLIDWKKSVNDTRIYNHVTVTGASGDFIPAFGEAKNNNPVSPIRIGLIGDRLLNLQYDFVTTNAQAQDLAQKFLAVNGLEEFNMNFTSLVAPWLEAGWIVQFDDPDATQNDPNKFLMTSFNIPLGLEPMDAVGRRVTIVS